MAANAVAPTRPSTFEEGIRSVPFTSACAGVANQPISRTEEPAVRFQSVVRLTGVNWLAVELSVMLARVAVATFVLTVRVAAFVAVSATVATFEVSPTWADAVLEPASTSAAVPTRAFFNRACIARLRAEVRSETTDRAEVQDTCPALYLYQPPISLQLAPSFGAVRDGDCTPLPVKPELFPAGHGESRSGPMS